ncbi:hypothetical protein WJX74_006321 [Apatococcus lobatus]|uniref:Ankyrin repeat domain-containing protein n=1 Tax=Apatococcus lobatus TaxID=904363 RepID=A0AAW1RAP7_9CHLO
MPKQLKSDEYLKRLFTPHKRHVDWDGQLLDLRRFREWSTPEGPQPLPTQDYIAFEEDFATAWQELFLQELGPLPAFVHTPCCGEFLGLTCSSGGIKLEGTQRPAIFFRRGSFQHLQGSAKTALGCTHLWIVPERLMSEMLQLPADSGGLAWIDSHEPDKLLLVPGLQAASITAAAAGDEQALAFLRSTVLLVSPAMQNLHARDSFCQAAFPEENCIASGAAWQQRLDDDESLRAMYLARMSHTSHLLHQALTERRLASLQWLRCLCHPVKDQKEQLIMAAAKMGWLDALQHLCTGPLAASPYDHLTLATAKHPHCLKWLLQEHPECNIEPELLEELAGYGDIDTLKWLQDRKWIPKAFWTADVTTAAVMGEQLAMLQWLRKLDPPCPWDASCAKWAVVRNGFVMLQWMQRQNPPCPLDITCSAAAAVSGNLDLLRWLRDQSPPCPWGESSTWAAVARGDLVMLEWLVNAGCEVEGPLCWTTALSRRHPHVLRWLHVRKIPFASPGTKCLPRLDYPSASILMLVGDMGSPLDERDQDRLALARRTFCLFHGLLRWCRKAVSDPSRGAQLAFDYLGSNTSGQGLLVRMSRLPQELIALIAVKADLQYDMKI